MGKGNGEPCKTLRLTRLVIRRIGPIRPIAGLEFGGFLLAMVKA